MLNTSSVHAFTPYFSGRFVVVLVALEVRRSGGVVIPEVLGGEVLEGHLVELHHLIEDNRRIRIVAIVLLDLSRAAGIVDQLAVPVFHLVGVVDALVWRQVRGGVCGGTVGLRYQRTQQTEVCVSRSALRT